MTTYLETMLAARGFDPRPAQTRLYEHLASLAGPGDGVVAQAGTGTGKSMAILAAATKHAVESRKQSIVVTPTLTLMNQYRDGDMPWAQKAYPDVDYAELRGRAHYFCEMTKILFDMQGSEYVIGCDGPDAGCTSSEWLDDDGQEHWTCDYQSAKQRAIEAQVIVTNSDMLIVNDRLLAPAGVQFFDLDGSLFVDEAHTLDQKLRDFASRSMHWKRVEQFKYAGEHARRLSRWLAGIDKGGALKDLRGFPMESLEAIAGARLPEPKPKDGLTRQREVHEAAQRTLAYIREPHDAAVLHVSQGSLKMDWINVAASSGELLKARRFGLVSATVPRTMPGVLGVPDARFIDVGHPFNYGEQAFIGFSSYGGDYRSAQDQVNFDLRVKEVADLLRRSKGGALLLFSSFMDLERVYEALVPTMRELGLRSWRQERDMESADRQRIADEFKADGDGVLFGSESFATGFDVPGDALRLVVLWKLPFPAVDPVSNAIRAQSFPRYNDMMKVRAVQGIGRLIRTATDRGIVWIADNRGRRLIDASDPLTSHIPEFARL